MLHASRRFLDAMPSLSGAPGRIAAYYAAFFLIIGIHIPYFPVWLAAKGLTAAEIAIVAAAPLAVRAFALPGLTMLADAFGRGWLAIAAYTWLALLLSLSLFWLEGFPAILVVSTAVGVLWGVLLPLTEAEAMAARTDRADYGRIRVWGSVAFVAASLGGGFVINLLPADSVLWLLVATALLAAFAALRLPRSLSAPGATDSRVRFAALKALVDMRLAVLLVGVGFAQGSHAVLYNFSSLHWQSQGIPGGAIGALWSIGVIAEIALFWFSGPAVQRLGAPGLLALGAAGGALRWTVMGFDPPLLLLPFLQAMHGLSFCAVHLGAVHALAAAAPRGFGGTTQGLYTIATGLGMALFAALSGPLYQAFAGQAYWVMAGGAALGLAMILAARSPQPQSAGSGGETRLPS